VGRGKVGVKASLFVKMERREKRKGSSPWIREELAAFYLSQRSGRRGKKKTSLAS